MFTTAMVTKCLTMMMVVTSEAAPMLLLGVHRDKPFELSRVTLSISQSHTASYRVTHKHSILQSHTQHITESHSITQSYAQNLPEMDTP